jgi:parallel beta-helix repeat protein
MKLVTVAVLINLLLCIPSLATARTWYITPDGTGDAPTIQAGIDAAQAGDDVLVAAGYYTWSNQSSTGTAMIKMKSGVWLHSESGPDVTTLDAEGGWDTVLFNTVDSDGTVEGFTVTGGKKGIFVGHSSSAIRGNIITGNAVSGIYIELGSAPTITDNLITGNTGSHGSGINCRPNCTATITNNTIENNSTPNNGGGIYCYYSSPTITSSVIRNNTASLGGGGIGCSFASPVITGNTIAENSTNGDGGGIQCSGHSDPHIANNTIAGNSAADGGGISSVGYSNPTVERNIISDQVLGGGLYCRIDSDAGVECNDLWNNAGGEGNCALGAGNISEDPLFCNVLLDDYHLQEGSPCAPFSPPNNECDLIGALDVYCPSVRVEPTTWGRVKAMYR